MYLDTGDNSVVRQVMLPIVGWDECRALSGGYQQNVSPRMICAGPPTGGKSICFGDSGGPLVCQQGDSWFQYGISSWVFTCTEPGHASVFASVVAYQSWIQDITGGLYLCIKVEIIAGY